MHPGGRDGDHNTGREQQGLGTNNRKLSAPCFQGMRHPLHRRLSLSILFLKLFFFSSFSLKGIPSSSFMTFFFLSAILTPLPLCPSQALSQLPFPSFFYFSLWLHWLLKTNKLSFDCLCHSEISPRLGWTADGVGGGTAMLGNLGCPKDSSTSKTFWIYEVLPTLWNSSAQFQLEVVELSFFHQVLHTNCESLAMASQIFLSSWTTT